MELENIKFLEQVPVYVWVIIAVIVLILFGDRKKWDKKARFPDNGVRSSNGSTGPGYVEVECYRKKGMMLTVELSFDEKYNNQPLQIYIGDYLAYDTHPNKNKWGIVKYKGAYRLTKPEHGEKVEVRSNGETILSSTLN